MISLTFQRRPANRIVALSSSEQVPPLTSFAQFTLMKSVSEFSFPILFSICSRGFGAGYGLELCSSGSHHLERLFYSTQVTDTHAAVAFLMILTVSKDSALQKQGSSVLIAI